MGRFIGWIVLPEYGLDSEEKVVLSRDKLDRLVSDVFEICQGRISICELRGHNGYRVIYLGDFGNHFDSTSEAIEEVRKLCEPIREYVDLYIDLEDPEAAIHYSLRLVSNIFRR